jgi:hypothetical protein
MTGLLRLGIACALSVCIAGCATYPAPTVPAAVVTPLRTKEIPARVRDAITVGSTKADVIAILGETLVVRFDSGFEVWVYRLAEEMSGKRGGQEGARSGREKADGFRPGEFVVLFAPSGIVAKTRIRPGASQ